MKFSYLLSVTMIDTYVIYAFQGWLSNSESFNLKIVDTVLIFVKSIKSCVIHLTFSFILALYESCFF
jgi:hypothetical protein